MNTKIKTGGQMPPDPETEDKQAKQSKKPNNMTKQAGLFALSFTTLLALGIITLVYYHVGVVEGKNVAAASASELARLCPPVSCTENTMRLLMEQDAQHMRTDRFRNAITIRLIVHVVAEVIALVLVVLGAVLIFDRIESNRAQGVSVAASNAQNEPNFSGQFLSSFPGLFLCLCGTGVIIYSIWVFSWPESRVTIYDRPVFVKDRNLTRNNAGSSSGQEPGTPVKAVNLSLSNAIAIRKNLEKEQ